MDPRTPPVPIIPLAPLAPPEPDPAETPEHRPARRPRVSRVPSSALAVLLIAGVAIGGAVAGSRRAPEPGRETTLWLAVESLATNGDLIDDSGKSGAERERFRARFGIVPQGVLHRDDHEGGRTFDAPWLWTRLAACARAIAPMGGIGPFALQGALVGLALVAAASVLKSRIGGISARLVAVVAFVGSPALLAAARLESFALEMAAIALAAAAVWHRRLVPAEGPEQIYGGELDARPSIARWLLAGACFGVALAGSPLYLPLALPLVVAAPKERRGSAAALFTLAAAGALAALVWLGGSPWEPLEAIVSPSLLGWSAIGLAIGRDVGILPFFAPLVLLLANSGQSEGRRWVYLSALTALVLQLLLAPFDFVAGTVSPGNGWFLPIYALLLAACEQAQSRSWTLATLLLSVPFLAPSWLAVAGPNLVASQAARLAAPIADRLPVASTLRHAPGATDLVRPELVVRAFGPSLGPGAGGGGNLKWSEREGELLVLSNRPLSSLRIEFGGAAPAEIQVEGGTLADTTFRPSGEVAFDVALPKDPRRHPVWWSREDGWIYPLRLRLPARPATPLSFDIPYARGLTPGPGDRAALGSPGGIGEAGTGGL